ncbi:MAG: hypothetical protein KGL39_07865 [Patescibacteria group bacterium]|nr:hypothetical protein [Patescibacteria group bacterium]
MPRVTKEVKFRRRLRVEQLLDEGVESSVRIAEILCAEGIQISDREVRSDIKAVGKEWHASLVELRHARQMRLVREAEEDNKKLLAEWERSKLDKQRRRSRTKQRAGKDAQGKQAPAETQAEKVTEGRLGDPRYLKVRAENREFIAETMGLKEPERKEITGADGGPVLVKTISGGASMNDL